mmetsp:Transcript_18160/g.25594  ORF Transcript_18160/g.25594 Transcript_18160/m.25594 type:complete len:285 (-) Transcript_18160:72-926(-)
MSTPSHVDQQTLPDGFSMDHNVVSLDVWEKLDHWLKTDYIDIQKGTKITATKSVNTASVNKEEDQEKKEYYYYKVPWQDEGEKMQHRRVAQFGGRYDYQTDIVDTKTPTAPIPQFLKDLLLTKNPVMSNKCSTVVDDGDSTRAKDNHIQTKNSDNEDNNNNDDCNENDVSHDFNQCIINEYTHHDTIIPWHKDHPDFGPTILVFTFGDDRPLHFRKLVQDQKEDNDNESGGKEINGKNRFCTAYPRHCSRYMLQGEARNDWEHSVPKGTGRRVSFTFRTLKREH